MKSINNRVLISLNRIRIAPAVRISASANANIEREINPVESITFRNIQESLINIWKKFEHLIDAEAVGRCPSNSRKFFEKKSIGSVEFVIHTVDSTSGFVNRVDWTLLSIAQERVEN